MIYGAHVATAGNFTGIPSKAAEMGAEIVQIFAGNPRSWHQKACTPEEISGFREGMQEYGLTASYIHMLYLTSYGTTDDTLRKRSIGSYASMLQTADLLGSAGVVTHLGSHKGAGFEARVQSLADGLVEAIERADAEAFAIVENSAGQGGVMGNSVAELKAIYECAGRHPKMKFCIDTAHLMGAGIEFRTPESADRLLTDLDEALGLENVILWHINDSKADLGSHKDRHENIGDGFVGMDGFKPLLSDPRLADTHSVLEVPGLDNKGPDAENVARLKRIHS